MKYQLLDIFSSFEEPFVHYCIGVEPSSVLKAVDEIKQSAKIIEIDGSRLSDLKILVAELNEKLGLMVNYGDTNSDQLLWMRLDDLIATDIAFDKNDGCILVIKNADQLLRSVNGGLTKFGQTMHLAGDENANPMCNVHGVKPECAFKPKFVHTVFCYNRIPTNAPKANKLDINLF